MEFNLIFFHWDDIYTTLGVKDFIYFISSPSIQHALFPIKIVFIYFTIFFFFAVIWFYLNSTYLQYKFLQDAIEFFSKETYGLGKVTKNWKKIQKRIELGSESELKLAIIEADDFLYEVLEDAGYDGATFEDLITDAQRKITIDKEAIISAHDLRNTIVYEPDYKADLDEVKKTLLIYENTIKNISVA